MAKQLSTANGTIHFPAYIPVTTFGEAYPLDGLIRPYLNRLSEAVMISYYYAKKMEKDHGLRLPVMIDSGGFAALFSGSKIIEQNGMGILEIKEPDGKTSTIHPYALIEFQEERADVAFTLDFPIPPLIDPLERDRRHRLTVANALWAIKNRRRKEMKLYACLQAWDEQSARRAAQSYANQGFDGVAIGGLVPRAKDTELIRSIVGAVREALPDIPLHAFGMGKPEMVEKLYSWGVDSVDSSSYVKLAAEGKMWGMPSKTLLDPSPLQRMHLALCNLAYATGKTLPLSTTPLVFTTASLLEDK